MENDEKVRKIMKNQRKILENEENVRKNEGKPMKNQGKVMENKEKVRKPCPRPKKNKIPKTRKKNHQKIPHPYITIINYTVIQEILQFIDLNVGSGVPCSTVQPQEWDSDPH